MKTLSQLAPAVRSISLLVTSTLLFSACAAAAEPTAGGEDPAAPEVGKAALPLQEGVKWTGPTQLAAGSGAPEMLPPPDAPAPPEWDMAKAGGADYDFCTDVLGALACWSEYGDKFVVLDTRKDGYSAVAEWWTYSSGSSNWTRHGVCQNALGSQNWGICNKNIPEDAKLMMRAGVYDGSTKQWVRVGQTIRVR